VIYVTSFAVEQILSLFLVLPSTSPFACPLLKRMCYPKQKYIVPISNNQNGQEEKEEYDDVRYNILTQEIESWNNFEYALREENRFLFNKMSSECKENEDLVRAANSKHEFSSGESLFMVLILQQQKTIKELIANISERKKEVHEINEWSYTSISFIFLLTGFYIVCLQYSMTD
jgi:hypothetical protein